MCLFRLWKTGACCSHSTDIAFCFPPPRSSSLCCVSAIRRAAVSYLQSLPTSTREPLQRHPCNVAFCLNELISVFSRGPGGEQQWLKILHVLLGFSFFSSSVTPHSAVAICSPYEKWIAMSYWGSLLMSWQGNSVAATRKPSCKLRSRYFSCCRRWLPVSLFFFFFFSLLVYQCHTCFQTRIQLHI